MTQRDQFSGTLGCLDRCNARNPKHIPLGRLAIENALQGIG